MKRNEQASDVIGKIVPLLQCEYLVYHCAHIYHMADMPLFYIPRPERASADRLIARAGRQNDNTKMLSPGIQTLITTPGAGKAILERYATYIRIAECQRSTHKIFPTINNPHHTPSAPRARHYYPHSSMFQSKSPLLLFY